jgi:hypothetical protein
MPKRYHNSKRRRHGEKNEKYIHENPLKRSMHEPDHFNDELHHNRGNERAVYRKFRASGNELYASMEPRRRQEMEDAGYLYEDHNAVANLPQGVIMKPYPKTGPYLPEGLEDSIRGIDHQMDYDDSQRRDHFYPKKH